ncbi:Transcriptional regulator ATRX [Oopsacas minuta]|uniref:ATP-dependent helicase ATRX n=1 Tax=Oopsacas minuta TaxID=111878 RepID=A0AAV7K7F6_9METZ|nr:Transcriptional regulator ATRX [Oopsacas minuta]
MENNDSRMNPLVQNVHLLGIEKALSTCNNSEKMQILQQLEATVNKFKPEVESAIKSTANIHNESDYSDFPGTANLFASPPPRAPEPLSPSNETIPGPSNAVGQPECNHDEVKKTQKHCTNCGKIKMRPHPNSDVIDLDTDSTPSSPTADNRVLCYSESSEDETNLDLLNIEYVPASQDESPDLLTNNTAVNTNNKQLRDIKIERMKSSLVAHKKSAAETTLSSQTSSKTSSPLESPKEDKVHVEFEIGAEISVPNTSTIPTPTKCHSSPLSRLAPTKRLQTETKRKGECTCCHQTTIHSAMKFTSHPWLGVLICQKCLVFISSGEYSIDEGKEIFCRWCGDGGDIANCGTCEKSFCKYCLNSNFGEGTWDKITGDDNWRCFICDDNPIKHLVEECIQLLREKEDMELAKETRRRGEAPAKKVTKQRRDKVKTEAACESSDNTTQPSESIGEILTPLPIVLDEHPVNSKQELSEPEGISDPETDSLSLSDIDLIDPPPQTSRKRIQGPLQSESDDIIAVQSDDKDKDKLPSGPVRPKKVLKPKPRNKKPRVDPFASSGDEATREITMMPVDMNNHEGSSADSDMFEDKMRRLDKYEYQVGSDEDQSTSERSESELKVKKRKGGTRRTKKNESEGDDELSLSKSLKSRSRRKRKAKLISDSSASSTTNSGSESEVEKIKKRGRKKIRKLISDYKLSLSTREAEKAEKERLQRLESKDSSQPVYIDAGSETNEDSDTYGDGSIEPLVLEKGNKGEGTLSVSKRLVKQLKPHQRVGVSFLWDSVCESCKMLRDTEGSGALLAHCMGLGKTIQVITLLDTLLRNSENTSIHKILIVTPVNVLYNWKAEFEKWVHNRKYHLHILESKDALKTRIKTMEFWDEAGGVLLSGYDMFRNFCVGKKIKSKKKKDKVFEMLVNPGAQFVICDEGHVMRNSKSGLSKCLNLIGTKRRIVLTGTPLQNNLQEYYCMTNFIKPNLLGSQAEFTNRFANPITNGQHADSTPHDVRIMKQRAHILHEKLKGCVQRQDYTALTKYLPPKHEYVLSARLTGIQINLYEAFLASLMKRELFPVYNVTRRIWSHPWILKKEQQLQRILREKRMDEDEMSDFIASNTEDEDSECEQKVKRKKLELVPRRHPLGKRVSKRTAVDKNRELTDAMRNIDDIISIGSSSSKEDDDYVPDDVIIESKLKIDVGECSEENNSCESNEIAMEHKDWFDDIIPPEVETQIEHSAKLLFLFELLSEAKKLNEKVLVFSQSLQMLDLIEFYLQRPEHHWIKGLHYYRMDGSTPIDTRDTSSAIFNNPKHPQIRLYLISTKAGSLGINLIAANRVVIMDASWNPTHDTQSIFRVYRFGQVKPVFIYRLIAKGTMEEKIYDRQVTKESLALRVIDEQQIGRHFTSSDLAELFRFEPEDLRYREPVVKIEAVNNTDEIDSDSVEIISSTINTVNSNNKEVKRPEADLVLCSILDKLQPKYFVSYHEHDSLTEHIFDEELSEDEKKAAWESYNTSKEAISREYVQQMWQDKQAQQNQVAQFELARQLLTQGQIPSAPPAVPRLPVPPIHQILATNSNQAVTNKLQHQILKQSVAQYQKILAMNPGLGNAEQGNLFASIHHQITNEVAQRNMMHSNLSQSVSTDAIRAQLLQRMPIPAPNMVPRHPMPPQIINRPSVPMLHPMPRVLRPQTSMHYVPTATTSTATQIRTNPPISISNSHAQNQGRVTKTSAVNEKSYPSFQEQNYPNPIDSISLLTSDVIPVPSNETID